MKFTFFIFFCCFCVIANSQDKIDTDRPDQTESAYTIPKGWIQFEMGFNQQKNTSLESESFYPTLLSKYGITKGLEFRCITTMKSESVKVMGSVKNKISGLEPVQLGAKVALLEEKKWIPKTSLIFHFAIPNTGSSAFNINKVAPNFRFTMQNGISKTVALGYNLGAEWDGVSNDPSYIYTFAPGCNISENWYGYIEAFGEIKKSQAPQHSIDGGIAYYVNNNFKLDLSSGFGLTTAAQQWYVAVGASVRFNVSGK